MDIFLLTSGVITLVLGIVFFRKARNITNWIKKNPKNHPSENDEGLFIVKGAGITLLIIGVILIYSQIIQFLRQLF